MSAPFIHLSDPIQINNRQRIHKSEPCLCVFRVQRKPSISIAMAFIPLLKIPFTILFNSTKENEIKKKQTNEE